MDNLFAILAGVLLVAAVVVTSLRLVRMVALAAGISAMIHFVLIGETGLWLALAAAFVFANGAQLAALFRRARSGNLAQEEHELLAHVLKIEEPDQQKRLLDLFEWKQFDPGQVLMEQGQAEPPLVYIASGEGRVEHDGTPVGTCGPGDFLGEMSAVSGEKATASIVAESDMRVARFDRDALFEMTRNMPEMRRAFDHALNRSLAAKVIRMNKSATEHG
uniref:Crp/Fnr family transcriptional regulator n=1 Tax=Parerythrobacter lutipelagi TaxID=1964208 RepID=UPI0010F58881|nr:cyclic nucleotide-binding domain-containing protein [Parerythrobacter lutipelagi]